MADEAGRNSQELEAALDNRMYYYKSQKHSDPQGFIPLEGASIRTTTINGKRQCIEIYNPSQAMRKDHPSYFMYADTDKEQTEWMDALTGNTIKSQGTIEKQGYLVKRGGMVKTWKMRWFVLKGNYLYYFKKEKDKEPLGYIPIDKATVEHVPYSIIKKNFCFEIKDASMAFNKWHRSYLMCAKDEQEMQSWMATLSAVPSKSNGSLDRSSSSVSGFGDEDKLS